jgi:hypothetical protein
MNSTANQPSMTSSQRGKVRRSMREFHEGILRSGSAHGPVVKDRKQAIAIALNQARREHPGAGAGLKRRQR